MIETLMAWLEVNTVSQLAVCLFILYMTGFGISGAIAEKFGFDGAWGAIWPLWLPLALAAIALFGAALVLAAAWDAFRYFLSARWAFGLARGVTLLIRAAR